MKVEKKLTVKLIWNIKKGFFTITFFLLNFLREKSKEETAQ
jgi:hypothetical protein